MLPGGGPHFPQYLNAFGRAVETLLERRDDLVLTPPYRKLMLEAAEASLVAK